MNTTDKLAGALPPLPPPHWPREYFGGVPSGAYTADQMQAYARAAIAAAPAAPAQTVKDSLTTAPAVDPCLALWQAMNEAEKYGQRTDDKLIVKFLREAGYVIAPAAPAPLTDEQISELAHEMVKGGKSINWLLRAIERAHGIAASKGGAA